MNVERRRQIEEVYRAARRQEPGHVRVFLVEACGADEELRIEVEALLNQPLCEAVTGSPDEALSVAQLDGVFAAAPARFQPSNLGNYRILRLLGEGGMGAVYEAEQEHPRRVVALKVIKPGLVSPELLRRFEHEVRALGRLQHPGIAQIYEAGTADSGFGPQPYFAMEFIRGRPLLEYAGQQQLKTRERLELMMRICEAVHHAHQRGLIHRDLKPGNILVDETGQPKILDFGVARATDIDAGATRQTDLGQLVGTLAYMSPEQALGDPLELDTRSDVYALGVILYELLAERMPYRIGQRLHEVVQAIKEEEPAPLSSINRIYRGDVETIVAKALEKDKTRRYASVADLGADIQRHLRDEPIVARPASTVYQLQKFARRRRGLVTGAVAVLVVLVAGIVVSTWQAARATQERNRAVAEKVRADTESATAKAVNDFLQNDLLAQASANVQAGPGTKPDPDLKVRTALDRAAARMQGRFDKQPLVEASIRQTIGLTYLDLGLRAEAQREIERAVALRRSVLGESHPDTLTSMSNLAELHRIRGSLSQAETLFSKILETRRALLGRVHPDTLDSMDNMAATYIDEGKYAQAGLVLAEAVDGRRRLLGEEHASTLNSIHRMAAVHYRQGDYEMAEALLSKVLEVQRRTFGEEHPDTLFTADDLAIVYGRLGKYREADSLLTEVLEKRRRVLGEEHPDTLLAMSDLGLVYREEGKYAQAEPLLTKAVEGRRRVLGEDHPQTLSSMNHLADLYLDQGKYLQAEALYRRVVESRSRLLGTEHPASLTAMNGLADLYSRQNKYTEAEALYARILETRRRVLGVEHPDTANVLASLGNVLLREHRYAEAEPLLREALGIQETKNSDSWEQYNIRSMLGQSLAGQEEYAEAEPLLLSGHEGLLQRKATIPAYNRITIEEAGERIIQLYQHWNKPEKAAAWREKLQAGLTSASLQP